MDDGFVLCPKNANIDVFRELLNEIHPSLKFTVEKRKNSYEQNFDTFVQLFRCFCYITPKQSVRN